MLQHHAKSLRSNQTDAEQRLWYHLRAQRMPGFKFKRQQVIGPYLVDFICRGTFLIVEVDGGQHADRAACDKERDDWLRKRMFRVLRVWNQEVLAYTDSALETIRLALQEPTALSPNPSPDYRRGE